MPGGTSFALDLSADYLRLKEMSLESIKASVTLQIARRANQTPGIMIHLQSISLKPAAQNQSGFPFNLPLVKNLDQLEFHSPVTFFVGENGSGKSTLLEAIGAGVKLATVGGDDVERDETLENARDLGKQLKFSWSNKTHRGFFLRAEDFFNFARRLQTMMKELQEIDRKSTRLKYSHLGISYDVF